MTPMMKVLLIMLENCANKSRELSISMKKETDKRKLKHLRKQFIKNHEYSKEFMKRYRDEDNKQIIQLESIDDELFNNFEYGQR